MTHERRSLADRPLNLSNVAENAVRIGREADDRRGDRAVENESGVTPERSLGNTRKKGAMVDEAGIEMGGSLPCTV